MYKQELM